MKFPKYRNYALELVCSCILVILLGCKEDIKHISLPTVQTIEVTSINTTTISSGGNIINNGGAFVTAKGLCWDTQPNPTIALPTKTTDGQGNETFMREISSLIPNQRYFLRAYATNSKGTAYGNEIEFFTSANNTLVYKVDGRAVKLGDPFPIALDLSDDGTVDFTIFVELTANSSGDRLYAGINPIGANLIKSGPAIDENFLSMGLLVSEAPDNVIDENLLANQRWTGDFGALVIRNTTTNGSILYEGNWANSIQIVGIQNNVNGTVFFGWLRIEFDKATETLSLIDYAFNATPNRPIIAGASVN